MKYNGATFPQRNNVLPLVTERKVFNKKKEEEKCFIDFCLCTADVKDRQKEGRTSGLNLS